MAVVMVDMVGEAVVIVTTMTIPTIPIMMEGPIPTMVAATVTSMRQALVVAQGRMNSLSSPPTRVVSARMLNHRQVPVVNVVDKMGFALGIIALRPLFLRYVSAQCLCNKLMSTFVYFSE